MYETSEGNLGLPNGNVWKCLFTAAKAFKLGKRVAEALMGNADVVTLLIDGQPRRCDTYIAEDPTRLLYVPVVINGRRTMRARPIIPAGWKATVSFVLLEDVLQPESLKPVIERAGRLIGLGDWRPIYGTFEAAVRSD